jgi:predicted flavoprotein YhiN
MNCGFEVPWSPYFKELLTEEGPKKVPRVPLKNCALEFQGQGSRGDLTLTAYGLEGSPVYCLSRELRDSLERGDKTQLRLDLFPDQEGDTLHAKLNRPRGKMSGSTFLRKALGLSKVEISLIAEAHPGKSLSALSAQELKVLHIPLLAPRPLDESISSSGGVKMENITPEMELRSLPGVYCIGEMLDWDAPTGGYLLQGCFSTAMEAAQACGHKGL